MIFYDPMLRVQRAKHHINDLVYAINSFVETDFYKVGIQFDSKVRSYFFGIEITDTLPNDLPTIIGDAVYNIRSSLDILICDVARANGKEISDLYFPFERDRKNFICSAKYRLIQKTLPNVARLLLDTVKPYKTGNFRLWGINKLSNIDKHQLLMPVIESYIIPFKYTENGKEISTGKWEVGPMGSRMHLTDTTITEIKNFNYERNGKPIIKIVFDKGTPFESKPVIETLDEMIELVSGIINLFENSIL